MRDEFDKLEELKHYVALKKENEKLRILLRKACFNVPNCVGCMKPTGLGHYPDCELAEVLK